MILVTTDGRWPKEGGERQASCVRRFNNILAIRPTTAATDWQLILAYNPTNCHASSGGPKECTKWLAIAAAATVSLAAYALARQLANHSLYLLAAAQRRVFRRQKAYWKGLDEENEEAIQVMLCSATFTTTSSQRLSVADFSFHHPIPTREAYVV